MTDTGLAIGAAQGVPRSADTPGRLHLSPQLHMLSAPAGPQAESIRVLRTHLLAQHLRDGRRSLAMCASSEGTGCTYMAANLAVAMAQTGVKTLLIDANLRAPGLDAFFIPADPVPGLTHALSDPNLTLYDVVQNDVLAGLSVLFAGARAPNAQELLGGAPFKALIDSCIRDYDLTIVDTPPANTSADARRIAAVLRYAIIVAKRDASYVRDLRTLAAELEGDRVRVVGTYLNDF